MALYNTKKIVGSGGLRQAAGPFATGDAAFAAGYASLGHGGGGEFYFQDEADVPDAGKIATVSVVSPNVNGATNTAPIQISTTVAHGFVTGQRVRIASVAGNTAANGDWTIEVASATTFDLAGSAGNASYTGGGTASGATLVTRAAHGFGPGGRLLLSRVTGLGAIEGSHDDIAVLDATTLSFAAGSAAAGSATSGFIGDGGVAIPSSAEDGRWVRRVTAPFDVKWFGAVADWDGLTGTDNLAAFHAAIAAMGSKGNKLIVDGHYYLGNTLVLTSTVHIEGTGMNEPDAAGYATRTPAGTLLVFPKNTTGLRIRSSSALDFPGPSTHSAERTSIRNLTVWCKELDATGDGVHASVIYAMEHVTVENVAGHGVRNRGSYPVTGDGNVSSSLFSHVTVSYCGVDGFHSEGGDANVMTFVSCTAKVNRRYGVYDETRMNAYLGVHCEGNGAPGLLPPLAPPIGALYGSEYHTEGETNSSTFLGCYSEGAAPGHESILKGQCNVIGGTLGASMIHPDSTCFVLENGIASRAPFVYNNTRSPVRIQSFVGTSDAAMIGFQWSTPDAPDNDYSILQYDPAAKYWALANSAPNRQVIRYPTTHCHWRQAAPWFLHGVFLGGDAAGEAQVSFIAAPAPPSVEYAGPALTYERGDVVWQSQPVAGGTLGSLCLAPGTQGTLNGGGTKGSIAQATDQLIVDNAADLVVGQYITIAGVSGIRQVTAISATTVTIDVAAGATVADAAVAFANASFTTFGEAHAPSTSYDTDRSLALADRFTTVTVTGRTMTLPAAPSDGQTHDVKSSAGVTTTVGTSGGALTIDGGASATVAGGQNRTFRYSAAVGEWETR